MRMVVACEENSLKNSIKDIVQRAGNTIIGEAADGLGALKLIRSIQPDFVILDYNLSIMDGLALARIIDEDKLAPVILLVDYFQREIVSKAREGRGFGYVLKPINEGILLPAIEFTNDHFHQVIDLQKEISGLRDTIEARKLIEKAKGILMKDKGLTEEEAFRWLQKQSMNRRKTIKQIADAIIMAKDMVTR